MSYVKQIPEVGQQILYSNDGWFETDQSYPVYTVMMVLSDGVLVDDGKRLSVIPDLYHYVQIDNQPLIEVVKEVMTNEDSSISHVTLNGRPICGARSSQNQIIVETGVVTCKRCLKLQGGQW